MKHREIVLGAIVGVAISVVGGLVWSAPSRFLQSAFVCRGNELAGAEVLLQQQLDRLSAQTNAYQRVADRLKRAYFDAIIVPKMSKVASRGSPLYEFQQEDIGAFSSRFIDLANSVDRANSVPGVSMDQELVDITGRPQIDDLDMVARAADVRRYGKREPSEALKLSDQVLTLTNLSLSKQKKLSIVLEEKLRLSAMPVATQARRWEVWREASPHSNCGGGLREKLAGLQNSLW